MSEHIMYLIQAEAIRALWNILVMCSAFCNKHIPANGYSFNVSPLPGLRRYMQFSRTWQELPELWMSHSPLVTWIRNECFCRYHWDLLITQQLLPQKVTKKTNQQNWQYSYSKRLWSTYVQYIQENNIWSVCAQLWH